MIVMMRSLIRLTEKEAKWQWGKEKKKAFKMIKEEFLREEWLIIFNSEKELIMKTDVFR